MSGIDGEGWPAATVGRGTSPGTGQSFCPLRRFAEFGSERFPNYNERMGFDGVAEIPAIAGCHALMPTAEEAVSELAKVFGLIEEEYRTGGQNLPRDTTEIVHA